MNGIPELINGVPRETWGTWCQHGAHVLVADPADDSDYPVAVLADPWPCGTCTPEGLVANLRQEEADFYAERLDEWRSSQ